VKNKPPTKKKMVLNEISYFAKKTYAANNNVDLIYTKA
jgi:hypothetical protein